VDRKGFRLSSRNSFEWEVLGSGLAETMCWRNNEEDYRHTPRGFLSEALVGMASVNGDAESFSRTRSKIARSQDREWYVITLKVLQIGPDRLRLTKQPVTTLCCLAHLAVSAKILISA
jgi:hypothetical protein